MQLSLDDGLSWQSIYTEVGSNLTPETSKSIDLTHYAGRFIRLRFSFDYVPGLVTYTQPESGWYFSKINFVNVSEMLDVQTALINAAVNMTSFTTPTAGSYALTGRTQYQNSYFTDWGTPKVFQVSTATVTAPGAPLIGIATAGDGDASVTFMAPSSNGGSDVTGYVAISNPGGVASVGCLASPCTVSGLSNGTTYNFTVAAANIAGFSNASASSNSVMPNPTNTQPPSEVISVDLTSGWNLIGNSVNAPLDAAATFGNANDVWTVWKWIRDVATPANDSKWAFFTPNSGTITDNGAAYAASKGYVPLTSIGAGEGFWVNAKAPFTAQLPAGTSVLSSNFQDQATPPNKLPTGWSLIAVGDSPSPRAFANGIALSPPSSGTLAATSLTTLWAWYPGNGVDQPGWYFYAPSLDNSGGLTSYNSGKGYFDFGVKTLTPATGFWVNKP